MKPNVLLTITSLLSILLVAIHLTEDIVRGFEPGKTSTYVGVLILAVWLYATLVLAQRRSGLVVLLLASILASGVPFIHMRGAGLVGGRLIGSSGVVFWVFTLLALGVSGVVSALLAAQELWGMRRDRARTGAYGTR